MNAESITACCFFSVSWWSHSKNKYLKKVCFSYDCIQCLIDRRFRVQLVHPLCTVGATVFVTCAVTGVKVGTQLKAEII